MTAAELIESLSTAPPDARVIVWCPHEPRGSEVAGVNVVREVGSGDVKVEIDVEGC